MSQLIPFILFEEHYRELTFSSCVIFNIAISYVAAPQALSHPIFKNPLLTRLITKIAIDH